MKGHFHSLDPPSGQPLGRRLGCKKRFLWSSGLGAQSEPGVVRWLRRYSHFLEENCNAPPQTRGHILTKLNCCKIFITCKDK